MVAYVVDLSAAELAGIEGGSFQWGIGRGISNAPVTYPGEQIAVRLRRVVS
jgi:hypothetical protein